MSMFRTNKLIKKDSDRNKEKRDIRVVFLVFSAIFAALAWRHYPSILSYVFIGIVLVILPLVAFTPTLLRPVFKLWMQLAHAVGWFNTQILLAMVFIFVFIPTGLIMKLLRKDPMKRKMFAEETYWEPYELVGLKDKKRYERQF
ncbi:MAG: hypothetical protein HN561_11165 [Candidatus Scalindua sp.]|nr:hypothetical protein [Candidatus Scalindua sp.]